jgi:hypothetical protein
MRSWGTSRRTHVSSGLKEQAMHMGYRLVAALIRMTAIVVLLGTFVLLNRFISYLAFPENISKVMEVTMTVAYVLVFVQLGFETVVVFLPRGRQRDRE